MKNKGHHYITESYQRNFSDKNGQVWILSPENKIFNTNPENTFKENHFYLVKLEGNGSLVVEKTLGQIEGNFNAVVKNKIEKREQLNDEDRMNISAFVASMLFRTKLQRENVRKNFMNIIRKGEEMKRAILSDEEKASRLAASSSSETYISLKELKESMKDFDSHQSISTVTTIERNAPIIFDMNWIIFEAPENTTFLSSDNPICMCSPEREKKYGGLKVGALAGLAHNDVELSFPISKRFALVASWKFPEQLYLMATPNQVDQINYRTMRSSRNIISENRENLEDILEKKKSKS